VKVLEHHAQVDHGGRIWDVRVQFAVEDDDDPEGVRIAALAALRRHLEELDEAQWMSHSTLHRFGGEAPAIVEGPFHEPERPRRPARPKRLQEPSVDLPESQRALCHRLIEAVWRLGVGGRAVRFQHIVNSGAMAQQTLTKLLAPGSDTLEFLRFYILVSRSGRHRMLDLNPQGRLLASQLRSGQLAPGSDIASSPSRDR
jgi:hypothetical protein